MRGARLRWRPAWPPSPMMRTPSTGALSRLRPRRCSTPRSGSGPRSGSAAELAAEPDSLRGGGAADEDDLAQVDRDHALLRFEVEPAVPLLQRLAQVLELRVVDPDLDDLPA